MKTPDLDKAFPKTPSYVHRCVLAAFEEGERRADQKRRRLTALCCAAAMAQPQALRTVRAHSSAARARFLMSALLPPAPGADGR